MKRVISLALVFVLCLSLCACGGGSPLTKDYQTEDEMVAAFEEYFNGKSWKNLDEDEWNEKVSEAELELLNNSAIHRYFQKSDSAVALAHRLEESIGAFWTPIVFECCTYPDDWYLGIVDQESATGMPLFILEWADIRPTCDSIADQIRTEFIDPMSVYVLEGYYGLCPPVDGVYEMPFEYYGIITVRATNSLGAGLTKQYVIHGTYDSKGEWVRIEEEFTRPSFDGIRYLSEELGVEGLFVLE